ncbi:unnamed protein product [Cuscuta campestris]|uniref:Auxin-responsive protein n=1 Tax=Cuscuta campestris TaxID=132261 RepID=A0A484MET5_9ASTE|nr:unnamed protein product [Cuscuta campestris]
MRHQNNAPSSVISSHSMHLGVLATAWHAIQTKTLFTVYYKPRTSPAEFIIPYDQFMESVKNNYTIGMRFKMRFEGEEAPEQRFTGTIVGIEDGDPQRWLESKWRCLKVRWDETSSVPRPDRVSPWNIEPALTPPALNPLPVPRPKRPRLNVLPSSPDSSVLTREGSSRLCAADHSHASGFSRVLQGQELSTMRGACAESNDSNCFEKPLSWVPPSLDDEKGDIHSRSFMGRSEPSFTDLLSGFGTQINSCSFSLHPPGEDQTSAAISLAKRRKQYPEGGSLLGKPWSSGLSLTLMDSGIKPHSQGSDSPYQARGDSMYGGLTLENQPGSWMGNHHAISYLRMPPTQTIHQQPEVFKPKEVNCKLFGIPLISNPPTTDDTENLHIGMQSHQPNATAECDQRFEQTNDGSKLGEDETAVNEEDKLFKDRERKVHSSSTRSCTKVHKQGTALGRSVDLTKFRNYDELLAELDQLFDFNGELKMLNKNWMVVYTDDEGDMMLVGDDPWQEFCGMVHKIYIYTKEEVQRMNPGTLNSKGEDTSSVAEGLDSREVKSSHIPSASSAEDC